MKILPDKYVKGLLSHKKMKILPDKHARALFASSGVIKQTNPKPLLNPFSSRIIFAEVTVP
jgi:hypothetical protein